MLDSDPKLPLHSDDSTTVAAARQDTDLYSPGVGFTPGGPVPAVHCGERPPELIGHPRYEVLRLIGAGGMGCVYQARHRFMDRLVALKVINYHLLDQPAMVAQFHREVRAAARLDHPNIVRAYDADQAGPLHFLVMEFVPGVNLDKVLADQGRLPIPLACDYARQTALALQHAHERGMVHRDIKPHNLMLTGEGQVKVLDFGLARFVIETVMIPAAGVAAATPESAFAGSASGSTPPSGKWSPAPDAGFSCVGGGTLDYIAPEEILDARTADIRADIYSLGCTLYRFLTGMVPFPAPTPMAKVRLHLDKAAEPLSRLRSDVPSDLVRAVERMMAKAACDRFQAPADVARALARFAGDKRPRVLIVDDEPAGRMALTAALEDEGYTVSCAANGREALEQLHGQPLPDLIVLDIMMPVMDGWQFLHAIKEEPQWANLPVIVLSGAEHGGTRAAALGVADYLQKPLPIEELATRIRRHAGSTSSHAATAEA